jgi:cysteinyl-tRNA synthetase
MLRFGLSMREIKLTNSMTGKKEVFHPRVPGKVSFYSCGPTVYNFIHIGNLRTALISDLIFRYFKRIGYEIDFVRNYTDVDDKIIGQATKEATTAAEIAKKYTLEVERDYAVAGMLEPTHKTTVTHHIPEIVKMIEDILKNGKAYVVDGEVFFAIDSFPGYGKLSHRLIDDLIAGARVEPGIKKKNPLDFSLWKPAKPGEPFWESPWGKGRPGWHIECSAMATKWLGAQIDLHHGGEDLIFPHHENEIAQTEAATGKDPFVKVWLHNAFLTMAKEKMSKSLGNVFLARDFLTQFSGEIARFLLLSIHYRTPIDFDRELVENSLTGLHRIYEAKAKAQELLKTARARADLRAEAAWGSFVASCEKARTEIEESFANDLNTAGAVGALFTLIRDFNRTLAEPLAAATPSAVLGAQELLKILEEDIGSVMNVGRLDPAKALEDIARVRVTLGERSGVARPSEDEIKNLLQQRVDARAAKNFARGDEIRKDLESRGVLIKDSPKGTTWEYK